MTRLSLMTLNAPPHPYGGFTTLLDVGSALSQLPQTGDHAWVWLFLVGPITVPSVLWHSLRSPSGSGSDRTLLAIGGLSFIMTIAMQFASRIHYRRYAYPSMWVGLIAFTCLVSCSAVRDGLRRCRLRPHSSLSPTSRGRTPGKCACGHASWPTRPTSVRLSRFQECETPVGWHWALVLRSSAC